jgi:hypothetical protein
LGASRERNSNRYQDALSSSKDSTRGAKDNASWNIRESKPVLITLSVWPGKYLGKADKGPIFLTIKMPDNIH